AALRLPHQRARIRGQQCDGREPRAALRDASTEPLGATHPDRERRRDDCTEHAELPAHLRRLRDSQPQPARQSRVPLLSEMSEEPVMNHERFNQRLAELRDNYQAGQAQLQRLEAQRSEIQQTLLRISGAIQVLEELLDERDDADAQDAADASTRGEVEALRLAR